MYVKNWNASGIYKNNTKWSFYGYLWWELFKIGYQFFFNIFSWDYGFNSFFYQWLRWFFVIYSICASYVAYRYEYRGYADNQWSMVVVWSMFFLYWKKMIENDYF